MMKSRFKEEQIDRTANHRAPNSLAIPRIFSVALELALGNNVGFSSPNGGENQESGTTA